MSIGQALREARLERRSTQRSLAERAFISDSLLSDYENGKKSMPQDLMTTLGSQLDNPRLFLEMVAAVTGGVYSSPWLDGDVDLHRVSVWAKTIEELHKGLEALGAAKAIIVPPDSLGEEQKAIVQDSLMQVVNTRVWIDHYIAVSCREYGISVSSLFKHIRLELENQGLLKARKRKKEVYAFADETMPGMREQQLFEWGFVQLELLHMRR